MSDGTGVCVADRSFKNGRGSAAYIYKSTIDSQLECTFVNQTPGHSDDQDAYRAELAGIYGGIRTITDLALQHNVHGTVTLGCDCTAALRKGFTMDTCTPGQPHYDLVQAIQLLLKTSHLIWKWVYVKAHQDDKKMASINTLGATKC